MEDWDFVDPDELSNWQGACICMTCQHFSYGVDRHCRTILGCTARRRQLAQGEHLLKRCRLWAPTWQQQVGWAPEVS